MVFSPKPPRTGRQGPTLREVVKTAKLMVRLDAFGRGPLWALLLLSLAASAAPAAAQSADAWFDVEIVLFTRGATGGFEPPADAGAVPDWSRARALQPGVTVPRSAWGADGSSGSRVPYALLPDGALALSGAAEALRRAPGLSPVIHLGWRQPIDGRSGERPLYLEWPPARGDARIQGVIALRLSRYLHVDVDFLRHGPPEGGAPARFQASRRMRSGELHYLDHPDMGMLIEVRRHGPAAPGESSG